MTSEPAVSESSMAPLTEARDRLSEIVDDVDQTGTSLVITKFGKPSAVVLGYHDYEALIETLNILSDSDAMEALGEAEADIASGHLIEMD